MVDRCVTATLTRESCARRNGGAVSWSGGCFADESGVLRAAHESCVSGARTAISCVTTQPIGDIRV